MPIPLPNLDDKTFADLVDEARASIPTHHPGWTDHNASDPGIALIEMFAWLTEMVLYRTNHISEATQRTFLKLLTGAAPPPEQALDEAILTTIRDLRARSRAITAEDYEFFVATRWLGSPQAAGLPPGASDLLRVRCMAEPQSDIHLVVAPSDGMGQAPWLSPRFQLRLALAAFFDDLRMVATRVHVHGPAYVLVTIRATLYLKDDARPRDVVVGGQVVAQGVEGAATAALVERFHPWTGGAEGRGWPFGRHVFASEIVALLDAITGVEFVEDVTITVVVPDPIEAAERTVMDDGHASAITLSAGELPRVEASGITFTLMERRGGEWHPIL